MVREHLAGRVQLRVFDSDDRRLENVPQRASLCEVCSSDFVVLAVPISSLPGLLAEIAPLLRPACTVLDTCSVKVKPVAWMRESLSEAVEIVGTHPLFGPDSGRNGIGGHRIVVCPARAARQTVEHISRFLSELGLVVLEVSPEEHDRQMARTQAIFHLVAQAVRRLGWSPSPITTPGPEQFYRLVESVQNDTPQLFRDLELLNPFAVECRKSFLRELERLDTELVSSTEARRNSCEFE
jgi:prephenate dehydrogenase